LKVETPTLPSLFSFTTITSSSSLRAVSSHFYYSLLLL